MVSFFHGLFPSGWRLLSPLLLCLPLHLHGGKPPLKDLIEAQRSSLHRSSTRKLPSSGNQSTKASSRKNHNLGTNMSHHSSSVNGEGTSHKDPLSRILDELSSIKLWKEKQERKEKGKKRVEEISQDERKKIREEERRKIMKEMKREKYTSYSSHNSCKSLSEELRDYYEGRHRSHLRPHSHRKDNVEANLDWKIRVEQQLKKKSTSKSYGSHSYPKKDQGQGILGVTPSKPKDDKGKTIEKQAPKASMQEKTSSIKFFKCLGREHITSQCPTTKTMIMKGQDIYISQDKATTPPSSSESEEAKGEESSEEIYPQEEGQSLVVKEKCKEVSVSSKRLAKKETHFTIKTNIKETFPLRQPPHFLFCKKTLASIATPLGLEFIPQVKKLLDEGLVRKSLNPCALLVPKIAPLIEMVRNHVPSWEDAQEMDFQTLPYFNIPNTINTYVFREGAQSQILSKVEGMMQSYPARALDKRLQVGWARDPKVGLRVLMSLRGHTSWYISRIDIWRAMRYNTIMNCTINMYILTFTNVALGFEEHLPRYAYRVIEIWFACITIICFSIFEWHQTNRVKLQFGLQQDIPIDPMNLDRLHQIDIKNKHNDVLTGQWVEGIVTHTPAYMEWYGKNITLFLSVAQQLNDPRTTITHNVVGTSVEQKIFEIPHPQPMYCTPSPVHQTFRQTSESVSTTSHEWMTNLFGFDGPYLFGEQGQTSSATATHIEYTNIEQQHHHDVGELVIQERRNPRHNRRPPPCGIGHRLGH
ncbi:Serine/threonine-protein phosphatase 7 long form [Glycine soja]